jgi:hypothetical protein
MTRYLFYYFVHFEVDAHHFHLCTQLLNLVDCREFRVLLLLLQNDLKERMIPHCTKLHELIMQAWQQYVLVLKKDLAVTFH